MILLQLCVCAIDGRQSINNSCSSVLINLHFFFSRLTQLMTSYLKNCDLIINQTLPRSGHIKSHWLSYGFRCYCSLVVTYTVWVAIIYPCNVSKFYWSVNSIYREYIWQISMSNELYYFQYWSLRQKYLNLTQFHLIRLLQITQRLLVNLLYMLFADAIYWF